MVRLSLKLTARGSEVKGLTRTLRSVMAQALGARGCAGCELSTDLNDPDAVHYVEQWIGESDLRRRIRSEEFHLLISVIEAAAQPPRLEIQFVSQIRGLDYVLGVLRRDGPLRNSGSNEEA